MDDKIQIKQIEDVELENPIIFEGLPGIGFVGKIVVDEIIKQLDATKFAELQSDYFPPQVTVKKDGLIDHMKNEFYYVKDFGEEKRDLVILTGNTQATDYDGQIAISRELMNFFADLGADKIFTLGGIGTGEMVEKNRVFVAGNDLDAINEVIELDNTHIRKDEGGSIIGASGLLLHYAEEKDVKAVCLMGETPGFFVDPSAAKEVLMVLFKLLGFEFDLEELDEKIETTLKRLSLNPQFNPNMMEAQQAPQPAPSDDLRYIG
ncbi:MAG: proteasome assembly chaperone family protein [Methanosphaera sp.]|uniref:proteasome assembly chaperone family protein n=1 Tax=Methanosphaera sp. TaxID=2666342 RepID=UPI0025F7886E|nr:proteasome assembly chaperone family protein [Methanosphaera sp.]MCI5866783.1 proteasome assembly chaperone family protein [Methanosphaera sp.]MDD6534297.1 proteasome assembly chaperone family protein [Methanosphaera sp.]MDY3956318.1 proteasome assembly chaperone family protein [Methanosphaera sp.]